ncbi:GntR family transcriptional regulator [Planobispora rosea]|uniref:GntR family transcriptional regulator n=1 Tax=Planobispora rosea TaxID=35762 RepID=UPI00083A30AD|nr:winged helix-turn-helix domain-containing protein [Planobispora rosea]
MTIDPDSYEPAYIQLAGLLRAAIDSGELAPGQPVPSEKTLIQQHGVARETVRRAISILRAEGRVQTLAGRGSYVRGSADEAEVVTLAPGSRISSRMPSPAERRQYGVAEGVPLFVVELEGQEAQAYPADRVILEVPSLT